MAVEMPAMPMTEATPSSASSASTPAASACLHQMAEARAEEAAFPSPQPALRKHLSFARQVSARGFISWDFPLSVGEKRERTILVCEQEVQLAASHAARRGHRLTRSKAEAAARAAEALGHRHEARALRLEIKILQAENSWLQQRVHALTGQVLAAGVPVPSCSREGKLVAAPLLRICGGQSCRRPAAHHHLRRKRLRRLEREVSDAKALAAEGRKALRHLASCVRSCSDEGARLGDGCTEQEASEARAEADAAQSALSELRRRLEEKDTTICSLRLQADMLGARRGLERQLAGEQDFGSRCRALMQSVSKLVDEAPQCRDEPGSRPASLAGPWLGLQAAPGSLSHPIATDASLAADGMLASGHAAGPRAVAMNARPIADARSSEHNRSSSGAEASPCTADSMPAASNALLSSAGVAGA